MEQKIRTMNIPTSDGPEKVELVQKFSHYIGNVRYWFALHKRGRLPHLYLAHYESGLKLTDVHMGYTNMHCARPDYKEWAKGWLNQLVESKGAARVESKLREALTQKIN